MLTNFVATRKTISYQLCATHMYITLYLGAVECLLLLVMALGWYMAICHPLHYTTVMNKTLCLVLAAATWVSSFILPVVPSLMVK